MCTACPLHPARRPIDLPSLRCAALCRAGLRFNPITFVRNALTPSGNLPLLLCWPALALFCLNALGIERLGVWCLKMEQRVRRGRARVRVPGLQGSVCHGRWRGVGLHMPAPEGMRERSLAAMGAAGCSSERAATAGLRTRGLKLPQPCSATRAAAVD